MTSAICTFSLSGSERCVFSKSCLQPLPRTVSQPQTLLLVGEAALIATSLRWGWQSVKLCRPPDHAELTSAPTLLLLIRDVCSGKWPVQLTLYVLQKCVMYLCTDWLIVLGVTVLKKKKKKKKKTPDYYQFRPFIARRTFIETWELRTLNWDVRVCFQLNESFF